PATPVTFFLDNPSNETCTPSLHASAPSWVIGFAVSALTLLIAIVALRMVPHSPATDNLAESTYNQSVELRRDAPRSADTAAGLIAARPTADAIGPPAARDRAIVAAPRPTPTVPATKPVNAKLNSPTAVTRREVEPRSATTSSSSVRQSTLVVWPPTPPNADAM